MPETLKAPICEEADVASAFRIIQEAVNLVTGKDAPITASTRIDQYFEKNASWDTLVYLELSLRLKDKVRVELSTDDWKYLSGRELCTSNEEWEAKYAPLFSFGRLADLIALRIRLGQIKSATILGATSLSAGAFRRIEEISKIIDRRVKPFAPSTPILDRFHGRKLRQLWGRLRAMSADRIPRLPVTLASRIVEAIWGTPGVMFAIGVYLFLFWQFSSGVGLTAQSSWSHWVMFAALMIPPLMGPPAGLLALIAFVLRRLDPRIGRRDAILPPGVRTFGDAALLVSGERGGWCEKCGYDLTGLVSGRCPECGTEVARVALPFKKKIEAVGS